MNRNSLKILFQDVDGCLNPSNGEPFGADSSWQPSKNQIATLRSISDAVDESSLDHFVINTGRFWPILQEIATHLPTTKLRYFIMEHACVIYDRVEDRNLDLIEIAQTHHLDSLTSRFSNLSIMRNLLKWYDQTGEHQMHHRYGIPLPRLDKIGNLSFAFPTSLDGAEVLETVKKLASASLPPADFEKIEFLRSDSFVDILPGIDKMDGIALILAILQIQPHQALAMGDYLNDLAIFKHFNQVLCPANSHPEIIALTRSKGASGIVSPLRYGSALLDFLKSP